MRVEKDDIGFWLSPFAIVSSVVCTVFIDRIEQRIFINDLISIRTSNIWVDYIVFSFFGNSVDYIGSNVDAATTTTANPLYTSDYGLQAGSPAIDAGTVSFVDNNMESVLDIPPSEYSGTAPDLGWLEYDLL